jgi:hypothetical protein
MVSFLYNVYGGIRLLAYHSPSIIVIHTFLLKEENTATHTHTHSHTTCTHILEKSTDVNMQEAVKHRIWLGSRFIMLPYGMRSKILINMLFCLGYKQYGSFERHIFYDNRDN